MNSKATFGNLSVKLCVSFFFVSCLISVLSSLTATFDKRIVGEADQRVEAIYIGENGEPGISFKDYEKVKDGYGEGETSAAIELQLRAVTELNQRSLDAKVVMTDENYINFFPYMTMRKGTFLDADMLRDRVKAAVVSSELAQKLYMTDNIIGNTLILGDGKYKIIGVYEADIGILSDLTDDGYEKIYIPYTSFETDKSIDHMMANGLKYKYGAVFSFEELINRALKRNATYNYAMRDYKKYGVVIAQIEGVLILLFGLVCIYLLIRNIAVFLGQRAAFYRLKLRDSYMKEMIRRNILSIVSDLAIIFAFAGILFAILSIVRFEFYVPSEYLPGDNIFDIGFYVERIKTVIRESNSLIKVNYAPFDALLQSTLKVALILATFIVVGFVDLILSLGIAKSVQMPKVKLAICSTASMVLGLVAGYLAVLFMGLSYSLPAEFIVLILCFYFSLILQFNKSYTALLYCGKML